MEVFDGLLALDWPNEFIVEYANGAREHLLRGNGVSLLLPDDDPERCGSLTADLPTKHRRNQKRTSRCVRFTELRGIYTIQGRRLWPTA